MLALTKVAAALAVLSAIATAAPAPNPLAELEDRDGVELDEGTSSVNIVGGEEAGAKDFPFIVSLSPIGPFSSHFCGGVLINANTVLTAGHCSWTQTASLVQVRAGSLKWASGGVLVNVSEIVVHEKYYDPTFFTNDIALWHLATPIRTSSTISYSKLPIQGSDPTDGAPAVTAGWGYTLPGNRTLAATLQKVSVPIVSRDRCQASYPGEDVTTAMICAGLVAGGKDACQGDSGGPIVDAKSKAVLGLTSWGAGCALPELYGVYTNVGLFVDWINTHKW
ncbi:extracellular trypsin protease [Microdochium trichocladiopsis]|uniref:Extracellular trypsin protease n=1 Tax=Microdochium trichocladiopsis TaxID=1682393 RepID=A0A9P9BRB5_9PEZI|nr:extracellular trypsin protease [Microdochium trichocladiopsis]KAH7032620.1 extracellular trypsin protease [Microdochium trichocladiopsis]